MYDEYLSAQLKNYIDRQYKKANLMDSENIIQEAKLRKKKRYNTFHRIKAMSFSVISVLVLYIVFIHFCSSNGLIGPCLHIACPPDSNASYPSNTAVNINDNKNTNITQINPKISPGLQPAPGIVTAGQWNDNLNWPFFQQLINKQVHRQYLSNWGLNPTSRIAAVVTCGGKPVEAATIHLLDSNNNIIWTSITNNSGTAYLFYNLFNNNQHAPCKLQIISGSTAKTISLFPGQDEVSVEIESAYEYPKSLDLMFVISTTGSMNDELTYLQAQLGDVVARVANKHDITLRLSYIFYRDEGEEYVVRSYPFVSGPDQINAANNFLKQQQVAGYGDYPEAVDKALEEAVYNQEWSETSTAKLLFLIHDAPAHRNEQTIQKFHKLIQDVSSKGIRIIPVASSGVFTNIELLMRALAITSGGTYVFSTDSPVSTPSNWQPTIGEFEVEQLNDQMVRIIANYLK